MVILALGLFHPMTNSFVAGAAQLMLYGAVVAPLFWVPKLQVRTSDLKKLLVAVWAFHTTSSAVGVLQAYFPGHLQPNLSSAIIAQGDAYVGGLIITLASGERLPRPMGLTDTPGGAAIAGMYAVLLSVGLLFTTRRRDVSVLSVCGLALGFFCLYLSQVRSLLVVTMLSSITAVLLAWWRGSKSRAAMVGVAIGATAVVTFVWAVSVGGESVTGRLATLLESNPGSVYYENRGRFLEHTFTNLLPDYPLGAGLGRWGMTYYYFGDKVEPASGMLWSEIMWSGWVIDGGAPLMVAYVGTLAVTCWTLLKLLRQRRNELTGWAMMIAAYTIAAIAFTFNANLFVSQMGMEFWLLNAALFAAYRNQHGRFRLARGLSRGMDTMAQSAPVAVTRNEPARERAPR